MIKVVNKRILQLIAASTFGVVSLSSNAIPYYYTFEAETTFLGGYALDYNQNGNITSPTLKNGDPLGPGAFTNFTVLIDTDKSAGSSVDSKFKNFNPNGFYAEFIYSDLPDSPIVNSPLEFNYAYFDASISPYEIEDIEIQVGNANNRLSIYGSEQVSWTVNQTTVASSGIKDYFGDYGYIYTVSKKNPHIVPELSAASAPISLALVGGLLAFGAERRRRKVPTL